MKNVMRLSNFESVHFEWLCSFEPLNRAAPNETKWMGASGCMASKSQRLARIESVSSGLVHDDLPL